MIIPLQTDMITQSLPSFSCIMSFNTNVNHLTYAWHVLTAKISLRNMAVIIEFSASLPQLGILRTCHFWRHGLESNYAIAKQEWACSQTRGNKGESVRRKGWPDVVLIFRLARHCIQGVWETTQTISRLVARAWLLRLSLIVVPEVRCAYLLSIRIHNVAFRDLSGQCIW